MPRRDPKAVLVTPKGLGSVLSRLYPRFVHDLHTTPRPASWQPVRDEKTEQRQIKRLLDTVGIAWYDTSQPFHAAITPGLPDLVCFEQLIAPAQDTPPWRLFFIEVKRRGEGQTPAQRLFEELCRWSGIPYVLGSTDDVARYLGLEVAADG